MSFIAHEQPCIRTWHRSAQTVGDMSGFEAPLLVVAGSMPLGVQIVW